MNRMEILSRLQVVFDTVFPGVTVSEKLAAKDVPGWDSIANLSLMMSIESSFRVRLPLDRVGKLADVGELISLIGTLENG